MIQKSKKIIMFTVIAVIIVATPLLFYEISSAPVPVTVKDGSSSYLWKCPFVTSAVLGTPGFHVDNLSEIYSVAQISSKGYENSSLTLSISGYEWMSEGGPVFILYLAASGNFSSNLHPKLLVLSQSISFLSPENTSGLPYHTDSSFWQGFTYGYHFDNLDNLSLQTSENNSYPQITGIGATSLSFNFVKNAELNSAQIYHFAIAPNFTQCGNSSLAGCGRIWGMYSFYPNSSYNLTYYTYFTASITGLSQPVYAQIELIFEDD